MARTAINQKQGIAMMVTFILGSTLVLGSGAEAKQDVWIAMLAAVLMVMPVLFIYARLLTIFPGKSLYEILEIVFGKVIGKILALLFIWFAFHVGSLVIKNFTNFIRVVSIPETPEYVIGAVIAFLCIWITRAGIEVIARWVSIILPVLIISILVVTLLLIPLIDLRNLKPVLYNGFTPVMDGAFSLFSFPFAETVIFTAMLNSLQGKSSKYKVYYWSLFIGSLIILLIAMRSLLTLGVSNISNMYFASYESVRLISIGSFLERIEVTVSVVFLFGGFAKTSMCLYAASSGMAKVMELDDYKPIVAPIGFLMMLLSIFIYNSTMEMFDWASVIFKFYAIPFEVVLPLIILVAAEIKVRLLRKKKAV